MTQQCVHYVKRRSKRGDKIMGHLGVSQIYSDQKNMNIILLHHEKHGEAITKQRVNFLIFCWKNRHKERARDYQARYYQFLRMSRTQQQTEIENAKMQIQKEYVTLEVTM